MLTRLCPINLFSFLIEVLPTFLMSDTKGGFLSEIR